MPIFHQKSNPVNIRQTQDLTCAIYRSIPCEISLVCFLNGKLMAKIRMPISNITTPNLAHNIAEYKYFLIKPTLFE